MTERERGWWRTLNGERDSKGKYPRRRNVAAQVAADKLKAITYATPPMEQRRKKRRKGEVIREREKEDGG